MYSLLADWLADLLDTEYISVSDEETCDFYVIQRCRNNMNEAHYLAKFIRDIAGRDFDIDEMDRCGDAIQIGHLVLEPYVVIKLIEVYYCE